MINIWPFRRKSNDNVYEELGTQSVIARGLTIEGNVRTSGEIHVNGRVIGDLEAQVCLIDAEGSIEGGVFAEEVYVRGRIQGPVHALHVEIHEGARVEGDIVNQTIIMENGAAVEGRVRHSDDPLGKRTPVPPPQDEVNDNGFRPLRAFRPL